MHSAPKLKMREPGNSFHSVTWLMHFSRYRLENVRYLLEAHFDLSGSKIQYARIFRINPQRPKSACSPRPEANLSSSRRPQTREGKDLIFSASELKIHSLKSLEKICMRHAEADWQKVWENGGSDALLDCAQLCKNPESAKLYDEMQLWKNFSGMDWNLLLSRFPEFENRCEKYGGWSKLEDFSWVHLLDCQPRFIGKFTECAIGKKFAYWSNLILKFEEAAEKCDELNAWEYIDIFDCCRVLVDGEFAFEMPVLFWILARFPQKLSERKIKKALDELGFNKPEADFCGERAKVSTFLYFSNPKAAAKWNAGAKLDADFLDTLIRSNGNIEFQYI